MRMSILSRVYVGFGLGWVVVWFVDCGFLVFFISYLELLMAQINSIVFSSSSLTAEKNN